MNHLEVQSKGIGLWAAFSGPMANTVGRILCVDLF